MGRATIKKRRAMPVRLSSLPFIEPAFVVVDLAGAPMQGNFNNLHYPLFNGIAVELEITLLVA